jgi:hypothetical protein
LSNKAEEVRRRGLALVPVTAVSDTGVAAVFAKAGILLSEADVRKYQARYLQEVQRPIIGRTALVLGIIAFVAFLAWMGASMTSVYLDGVFHSVAKAIGFWAGIAFAAALALTLGLYYAFRPATGELQWAIMEYDQYRESPMRHVPDKIQRRAEWIRMTVPGVQLQVSFLQADPFLYAIAEGQRFPVGYWHKSLVI